jgi:hypothetical protein
VRDWTIKKGVSLGNRVQLKKGARFGTRQTSGIDFQEGGMNSGTLWMLLPEQFPAFTVFLFCSVIYLS